MYSIYNILHYLITEKGAVPREWGFAIDELCISVVDVEQYCPLLRLEVPGSGRTDVYVDDGWIVISDSLMIADIGGRSRQASVLEYSAGDLIRMRVRIDYHDYVFIPPDKLGDFIDIFRTNSGRDAVGMLNPVDYGDGLEGALSAKGIPYIIKNDFIVLMEL